MHDLIWLYVGVINIVTAVAFANDKRRARQGSWRTPERTLLLLCLAGGSAGGLLAMRVFRHKTRHLKFTLGVPLILAVHIGILIWYLGIFL